MEFIDHAHQLIQIPLLSLHLKSLPLWEEICILTPERFYIFGFCGIFEIY